MAENFTTRHQKNHRSIRFFKDRALDPELLEEILAVAERTASSVGMQTVSLIRLTEDKQKQAVMEIAGQAYIAQAPELFIFVIDLYRNMKIAEEKGQPVQAPTMNHFFQGLADAHLMAQNMMNAIESLGLGGTFLGNILNDPVKEIEILDLPPYTFPILGMIAGYVDDDPQLKPRIPMEWRVSENTYHRYDSYLDLLADYDQQMTHYYDTRQKNRRSDSFSKQVVNYVHSSNENRNRILKAIQDQGFDLGFQLEEKED